MDRYEELHFGTASGYNTSNGPIATPKFNEARDLLSAHSRLLEHRFAV
jgi:hypothetical protein